MCNRCSTASVESMARDTAPQLGRPKDIRARLKQLCDAQWSSLGAISDPVGICRIRRTRGRAQLKFGRTQRGLDEQLLNFDRIPLRSRRKYGPVQLEVGRSLLSPDMAEPSSGLVEHSSSLTEPRLNVGRASLDFGGRLPESGREHMDVGRIQLNVGQAQRKVDQLQLGLSRMRLNYGLSLVEAVSHPPPVPPGVAPPAAMSRQRPTRASRGASPWTPWISPLRARVASRRGRRAPTCSWTRASTSRPSQRCARRPRSRARRWPRLTR